MKNLLSTISLFACMLFCVVSCKKENTERHYGIYPILFSSSYETKATANVSDIQKNGFKVFAFYQANGNDLNFEKSVTYKSDQKIYDYEGVEYWIPGATYWFKAVYPKELTYTIDNSTKDQRLTISNFDITSQQDILVATTDALVVDEEMQAPATGSVVGLQFQHLLANVVVKIKAEVNVTINDITLKYIPVKGTYNNGLWVDYSEQGNIEKVGIYKSLSSSSNEYHDVTAGGFLVFPNSSVDGSQYLYIRTSDKTYDLPLPSTPNKWVAGNRYTYTLVIMQNDILFDEPTVEEWDEENATGSVVIK